MLTNSARNERSAANSRLPPLQIPYDNPILEEKSYRSSSSPPNVHEIVQLLSGSSKERSKALKRVLEGLSHEDVALHNCEMELGVDRMLCLQLCYLEETAHPSRDKEQALVCSCLCRIYQCSRDWRFRSFQHLKQAQVFTILTDILQRPEGVMAALGTIRVFAKLDVPVRQFLVQQRKLVQALDFLLTHRNETYLVVECTGLLKDLTFRLEGDTLLYIYNRMRAPLLNHARNSSDIRILESISATFWNFAIDTTISTNMAKQAPVLSCLGQMLKWCENDYTKVRIKRNTLSALGNIASSIATPATMEQDDDQATVVFCQQTWFLPTLLNLLKEDTDGDVQRRALRTIRCLSSCSWGRTILLGQSDCISSLMRVLKEEKVFDADARIQACETVANLSQEKGALLRMGPVIETTLLQTIEHAGSPDTIKLTIAGSRALSACMENSCWRRGGSFFSERFFDSLMHTSKASVDSHPIVAKLLLQAALELDRPEELTAKHPMACSSVLDIIVHVLSQGGTTFEQPQNDAMEVLLVFLKDEQNKSRLAENEGLLTALVSLALTIQGPKKDVVKRMILDIVPEL